MPFRWAERGDLVKSNDSDYSIEILHSKLLDEFSRRTDNSYTIRSQKHDPRQIKETETTTGIKITLPPDSIIDKAEWKNDDQKTRRYGEPQREEADNFNALRDQYSGQSLDLFADILAALSIPIVDEGELIEAESMNLLLKTLNALYESKSNLEEVSNVVTKGDLITTSSGRIAELKTMFNNMLNHQTNSEISMAGCNAACQGLCLGICTDVCTNACGGSCISDCSYTCTNGCFAWCESDCGGNCAGGCTAAGRSTAGCGGCGAQCTGCTGSCGGNGCGSNCLKTCMGGCSRECAHNCNNGHCKTSCTGAVGFAASGVVSNV